MMTLATFVNRPKHLFVWQINMYFHPYNVKDYGDYESLFVLSLEKPTEKDVELLVSTIEYWKGWTVQSIDEKPLLLSGSAIISNQLINS